MNETKDVYEIDLIQLIKALLKKWWAMALPALVGAILMFSYTTLFVTPLYRSTAKMYINASTSSNIDMSGLSTARDLVETYAYLVKNTRMTLEEVAEKTGLDYSYEQMRGMISVAGGGSTEFLEITVACPNPEHACLIANTVMEILPGRAAATNLNSTISAADWATVAKEPSSPNTMKNVMLGFIVGCMLGAAVIVLKEIFDDKLQSESWLQQAFKDEIPVLAVIPSTDRAQGKKSGYNSYYGHYAPNGRNSSR
ncbi:MAG: hypothetical protein J6R04_06475 [Clostridia bacterium]|nr:hypothetical protein [Clostridia bacterium]